MRLIIKIPDEIRKGIYDGVYCGISDKKVYDAIKNGTPLPKGHGRLIDADDFFETFSELDNEPYNNFPAVIEADKEAENE